MTSDISALLEEMVTRKASDLYITMGCPPTLRLEDKIFPLGTENLSDSQIQGFIEELLDEDKMDEFESTLELNTAINWQNRVRFRANFFYQQQHPGIVIRRITSSIPTLDDLGLPPVYSELIMRRRGLILVVGTTGSGKSTSLAAMLGYRNHNGSGHIITIEDPIEYIHDHDNCIITQREIGIDTYSYGIALKNALRQRPDIVLIGEIRDQETMEQAINFAESGHLCVATLHANNANQAIQRILNLFPEARHKQILHNLSHNLLGILSQRLVPNTKNGRALALEVMLNEGLIRSLIEEGNTKEIKEVMAKSSGQGMQTFDHSLLMLYQNGDISEETAISESDNPTNLKLQLKQYQSTSEFSQNSAHGSHLSLNLTEHGDNF